MSSRFDDLFNKISLSDEKSNEILRKVKKMNIEKDKKVRNPKSIYVTIGAMLTVIAIIIAGGAYLIGSGGMLQEEYLEPFSTDEPVIETAVPNETNVPDESRSINFTHESEKEEESEELFKILERLYSELDYAFDELGKAYDNLSSTEFEKINNIQSKIEKVIEKLPDDYNWGSYANWDFGNINGKVYTDMEDLKSLVYDEAKIHEQEYSDISEVKIEIVCSDINITKGGDKLYFKYGQWYDEQYKFNVKDGKLILSEENVPYFKDKNGSVSNTWFWNTIKGREVPIEIIVPEGMEIDFKINLVSGDIDITDCIFNGTVKASTVSGDVNITSSIISGKIDLNAVSGKVNVTNCTVKELKIDMVDGKITVTDSKMNGKADINIVGGTINVTESKINERLSISYIEGNVNVRNSEVQGDIKINSFDKKSYEIYNCTYNNLYFNEKKQ